MSETAQPIIPAPPAGLFRPDAQPHVIRGGGIAKALAAGSGGGGSGSGSGNGSAPVAGGGAAGLKAQLSPAPPQTPPSGRFPNIARETVKQS